MGDMTIVMAKAQKKADTITMDPFRPGLILLPLVKDKNASNSEIGKAEVLIFRSFFVSGIVTILTVGCLLGAFALFGISKQESYTSSSWTPYVLAHANSQLYGWVGLFVMGFAMQQHGTSVQKSVQFHRVAYAALVAMILGIIFRFVAEPMAQLDPVKWVWLGVFSGILQIISVTLFCYNIGANRHRNQEPITWTTAFVFASLICFITVSLIEPWVFLMSHQAERYASIAFIAQWLTPLRETQFLGFAAMMIFGVATSKFPGCLGFQSTKRAWGLIAFTFWIVGLIFRVSGWNIFYNSSFQPGADLVFRLGGLFLFLGAVCMSICLGVFEKGRNYNASQKFLRAAFLWLLVAGLLLLAEPLHLKAIGAPFSHAYTGGIRHAVTVGFISQMIIGVGYHLVTRMAMISSDKTPQLWSVFILINFGNAARVALEIFTDFHRGAFAPMGWTGFIELCGLMIWAFVMLKFILQKRMVYAESC